MATKAETLAMAARGEGCLGKAAADEPVFVLRAQDLSAPFIVRQWVLMQRALQSRADAKIAEAERVARAMEAWAAKGSGRGKVAD